MSDIFQEVEEEVRREHYEKLWKKYGNYVIAGASAIVIAVAGFQIWRTYDLNQRRAISDRYQAALQMIMSGNAVQAEQAFSTLADDTSGGYETLSKFQLASAYLAQGKRDPAIGLLRELTGDSNPVIANAARLRLAWTLADASPKAEVAAAVAPLSAPDSPWRFAAAEVLAYMDLKDGATAQAEAAYAQLAQEQQASPSLRQRAAAIAEYLKANPTAGSTPASATIQGTNP